MIITSFVFLVFFAVTLCLYYLAPGKFQWLVLLAAGLVFAMAGQSPWLVAFPILAVFIVYTGALCIDRAAQHRKKRAALGAAFFLCLLILAVLKYSGQSFLVPMGISFYTLSLLGYLFDVYYGIAPAEKNFGRLLLFGSFFPLMTSGPIVRYTEIGPDLCAPHKLDYTKITAGLQRMIGGFIKKLVIAERCGVIVNTVYGDYETYAGLYIPLAVLSFTFQLYMDFSGCMDIVIGAAEALGIRLPENFNFPFSARSISEYWRRWHITLGTWLKDYLFYPLLRTRFFMKLPVILKQRLGKKAAKQITTFSAMFILWFVIGLWHGNNWTFVIGSGLLHWTYIVGGEALEPLFKKMRKACRTSQYPRVFIKFQQLRTFLLVCFGLLFFRAASLADAVAMIGNAFTVWNPGIFTDGGILTLGLDAIEISIAVISLLLLRVVGRIQQKKPLRQWISEKPLPVRWAILYMALFYVILLGFYGPGFSQTEFIYGQF